MPPRPRSARSLSAKPEARKGHLVAALGISILTGAACAPLVKIVPPPTSAWPGIDEYVSPSEQVLVLPIWNRSIAKPCRVRKPLVARVNQLSSIVGRRRLAFGSWAMDGHGVQTMESHPSGALVLALDGTVLWATGIGVKGRRSLTVEKARQLEREVSERRRLQSLYAPRQSPPGGENEGYFAYCLSSTKYTSLHASDAERKAMTRFLSRLVRELSTEAA